MECFIVLESDIDIANNKFTLRGDEARHAVRVLRISEGEHIMATTLAGICYEGKCIKSGQAGKNEWLCECSIDKTLPKHNEPSIDIQLIQGIPMQQSKLEEIVERSIEIGISSFVPIYSKRTEKKTINTDRLEKIAKNACKQSYRAQMPVLLSVCNFTEALQKAKDDARTIILLHESAPFEDGLSKILKTNNSKKISLVIGPEGGFDESEVLLASNNYGAFVASLGTRRLRAETAAIMAVSITMATE
jgi:16S rRNA (uracil1498-N3)-methyltransferase